MYMRIIIDPVCPITRSGDRREDRDTTTELGSRPEGIIRAILAAVGSGRRARSPDTQLILIMKFHHHP